MGSQHSKLLEAVSVSSSLADQSLIQTDVTSRITKKNKNQKYIREIQFCLDKSEITDKGDFSAYFKSLNELTSMLQK